MAIFHQLAHDEGEEEEEESEDDDDDEEDEEDEEDEGCIRERWGVKADG